eukprot:6457388-Amphidinium_carterae.1
MGQRQVLLAADWNFEPEDMAIDLIHGAVSMSRTRALGLPAHVKARIVKSLLSVGLNDAKVHHHDG